MNRHVGDVSVLGMRDNIAFFLALLVFVLCVLAGAAVPTAASGQTRMTNATALHRLCTSEVTWNTDVADCDGIHAVLRFRMAHIPAYRGDTLAEAANRYSGGRLTRVTGSRPWVGELEPSCPEPASWNPRLPWVRHRRGCRRMYLRVLDILRGERDWVVRSPVHDWGASSISERYQRNNADAVRARFALPTANDFWELERYTAHFGDT